MVSSTGLLVFAKGALRHYCTVPSKTQSDVIDWVDALQEYSNATITQWYFITSDATIGSTPETEGDERTVETFARLEFATTNREFRGLKIPAPKSDMFEDQEDRGNRVTKATGNDLAAKYTSITEEEVSFKRGTLRGGSALSGHIF